MRRITKQPPVFILSSPRSGSTMLRLTLGKFNEIISLPETHFFNFHNMNRSANVSNPETRRKIAEKWVRFHTVQRMDLDTDKLIRRIEKEGRDWQDIFEMTVEQFLIERNIPFDDQTVIVEKTPAHIFFQDSILATYPDAKFIYLVRDPRDVVASLKHCTWSTSNIITNSRIWYKAAKAVREGNDRITVIYEELVRMPEQALANMAEFLQLKFEAEILDREVQDDKTREMASSKKSYQPISTKNIGSWKDKLSGVDRDKDLVEWICENEMKRFGYQPDGIIKDKRFYRSLISFYVGHYLGRILRV